MSKRKWDEPAGPAESVAAAPNQDALDAAAKIAAKIADQYGEGSARKTPVEDHDPPFVKDIEINDLRNRYMLTKGSTQTEIYETTQATVTTRGAWYPDKTMATEKEPPLHLHITALSQESLDKGVAAVEKLMDQELGSLTVRPEYLERPVRPERERRRWPEHKVIIGLDNLRNFNVRAKVVGPGGLFVKYIQQETNTRVQIKGQGSGFIEPESGREGEDPMHINIAGPDEHMLNRAKELAEDLLVVVTEKWHETSDFNAKHQAQLQQQQAQAAQAQQSGPASTGLNYYTSAGAAPLPVGQAPPMPGQSPVPQQPPPQTPEQAAYWAQINSNPEWANYYHQLFQQYGYAGVPAGYVPPGQPSAPAAPPPPPPPPPSEPAPAPPPPSDGDRRQGGGAYGAVAPPPGL